MKKAIFSTLALIVAFIIFMYFRLGMYKEVKLEAKQVGPLQTLSLRHTGPYYKIAEVIETVEKWAKANHIKCEKTFGEYFDDPKTVAEDRLQSRGGCLIEGKLAIAPLAGMIQEEIPAKQYLVGSFEGAPSVGPYTVYPKAFEWIESNGFKVAGPVIEIYTVLNEKEVHTDYLFPLWTKEEN